MSQRKRSYAPPKAAARRAQAWLDSQRVQGSGRNIFGNGHQFGEWPITSVRPKDVPNICRTARDWSVARQVNGAEGGRDYAAFRNPRIRSIAEDVGELLVEQFGFAKACEKMGELSSSLPSFLKFSIGRVTTSLIRSTHLTIVLPDVETSRRIKQDRLKANADFGIDATQAPEGVVIGKFLDSEFALGLAQKVGVILESQPPEQTQLLFGVPRLFIGDSPA